MSPRLLIVVPTYNEADNLPELVARVQQVVPGAHLLVVDDASPDGTADLAARLAARDERLHLLRRQGPRGLGLAYLDGFRWGLDHGYERLVEMDADLSHDPVHLPALLAALDAGADLAIGSRNVPGGAIHGWSLGRRLLSRGGSLYSRLILGLDVRDLTSGFKAYTRRAVEQLGPIASNGYSFQIETTYRVLQQGLRVVEVPIVFVDRRAGRSKMSRTIFVEAIWMVWKLRLTGR